MGIYNSQVSILFLEIEAMIKQADGHRHEQSHSTENACSEGWIGSTKHWLMQWFDNQALIRELERWDSAELDRLLAESGVNRRGLNALLQAGVASEPLTMHVMERFGVTQVLNQRYPEVLRDAQRVCTTCTHKAHCRRTLKETSGNQPFRSFCLNAGTFEAMDEMKTQ